MPKFVCPECGSEELIRHEYVVKGFKVTSITDIPTVSVDIDDTEQDVNAVGSGMFLNYCCGNTRCGMPVMDKADNPIEEDGRLVEWIKENCPQ